MDKEKIKKLLIMMFPNKDFFNNARRFMPEEMFIGYFQQTLNKRYREQGYQIIFVEHQGEDQKRGIPLSENDIAINTGFNKSNEHHSGYFERYDDVASLIATTLEADMQDLEEVVVAGFHSFDCCNRMANAIKRAKAPVIIDTDITELFINRAFKRGKGSSLYDYDEYFNPEVYDLDMVMGNIMFELTNGKFDQNDLTSADLGVYGMSEKQAKTVSDNAELAPTYRGQCLTD